MWPFRELATTLVEAGVSPTPWDERVAALVAETSRVWPCRVGVGSEGPFALPFRRAAVVGDVLPGDLVRLVESTIQDLMAASCFRNWVLVRLVNRRFVAPFKGITRSELFVTICK